jgi:hypothetical protein
MPTGFSKSILAKRVQGSTFKIVDQAGNGLSNVTVTTDANANISLTYNTGTNFTYLLPPGQQVITATKAGYVTKKTAVDVTGVVQIIITLADATNIQSTQTITNADSVAQTVTNTARTENNATVDFPAGAIVDSIGNTVSAVTVQITNVAVSDTGSVDTFPGSFVGNDSGTTAPIESFGFMNVNLTNTTTGAPLTIDPAIGATVRLPVDPDPVGEDSIPTYRLDESSGEWILQGTAYRIPGSNIFEFPVTSFSWWNLDRLLGVYSPFECEILENEDDSSVNDDSTTYVQPLQPGDCPGKGVRVIVTGPNYNTPIFKAEGISNAQGVCNLPAVPGGMIFIYGIKGNTYYTPTSLFVNNGTIKTTLRPNGTIPVLPPYASLTSNKLAMRAGETVTFNLNVQGVPLTSKNYTITGVTSSDISGAALTGSISLTESFSPGRFGVGDGTLVLTAAPVGLANKTFTVTLNDTIGGQVISQSVTILSDSVTSTLSIALDTTGTGNSFSAPLQGSASAAPGYKVRISLSTVGVANATLPYTISGVTSGDISGAALTGNFVVSNGYPTFNSSYSSLILTINPALISNKTLTFTVNNGDSTTSSVIVYISTTPPS